MLVCIHHHLSVPPEIAITTLRSNRVLWSNTLHIVYFIELTVPREDAADEANERKKLLYVETAIEAEQQGWRAIV